MREDYNTQWRWAAFLAKPVQKAVLQSALIVVARQQSGEK
jgi:hypothetical protein